MKKKLLKVVDVINELNSCREVLLSVTFAGQDYWVSIDKRQARLILDRFGGSLKANNLGFQQGYIAELDDGTLYIGEEI